MRTLLESSDLAVFESAVSLNDRDDASDNFEGNPLFVGVASDIYRLRKRDSVAEDSANPEYGIEADADHVARPQGVGHDVGAFECVENL